VEIVQAGRQIEPRVRYTKFRLDVSLDPGPDKPQATAHT
jgi:hypothetical protein